MATPATNPFRVSDLVAKYGWQAMIYLAALGINDLAEAQVLFVDSGHTNALDADDTEHGHSFTKPLATVDYAVGLSTASERAIILLAPGHVESYDATTTGFDADVVGVRIIGIGSGSLKPRFDFDDATSKCVLGANDVQIKNVVFRPSVPTVTIGLEIETDVTSCSLEDVDFAMGEDGGGTDEFIKAVRLVSGNHDTVFKNVKILVHASAGGATHGIHIDAASDRLVFDNVIIDGPWATGGIVEDATGVSHVAVNCAVDVTGTNYGFYGSSTFAKRVNNVDGQVREDDSESLIVETRGTGTAPTGITDESIFAYIMGKGAPAQASTFNNTTDSLEAISNKINTAQTDLDTITGASGVNLLTATQASIDAIDPGATRIVTATLTDWALTATNALFTVSGMVKARIWGEVLVAVAGVATNLKISCTPTAPGGLVDIASNLDCNADAAGTIYKMNAIFGSAMVEVTVGVSADDGVEVILPAGVVQMGSSANEGGGGSIQWFCQYEPLEAGAAVTAT